MQVHDPESKPGHNVQSVYNIVHNNNDNARDKKIELEGSQKPKRVDDSDVPLYSLAGMEPHKYLSVYDAAIKKQGTH